MEGEFDLLGYLGVQVREQSQAPVGHGLAHKVLIPRESPREGDSLRQQNARSNGCSHQPSSNRLVCDICINNELIRRKVERRKQEKELEEQMSREQLQLAREAEAAERAAKTERIMCYRADASQKKPEPHKKRDSEADCTATTLPLSHPQYSPADKMRMKQDYKEMLLQQIQLQADKKRQEKDREMQNDKAELERAMHQYHVDQQNQAKHQADVKARMRSALDFQHYEKTRPQILHEQPDPAIEFERRQQEQERFNQFKRERQAELARALQAQIDDKVRRRVMEHDHQDARNDLLDQERQRKFFEKKTKQAELMTMLDEQVRHRNERRRSEQSERSSISSTSLFSPPRKPDMAECGNCHRQLPSSRFSRNPFYEES